MVQPFDHNYFLGYVNQVFPDFIRIHFPSSVLLNKFIFSGEEFNAGLVGNYVTIEGENFGFLGKILELSLPEKERLELNEKAFRDKEFHPTGKVEILLCFDYFKPEKVTKGLTAYPNIGSKVFVCSANFIQNYFRQFGVRDDFHGIAPTFDFATLTSDGKTSIEVSQQALFGRHCAIVGTTGGGKSWTVSKCLEEVIKNHGKAIVIDATGEYNSFDGKNSVETSAILTENSFLHYSNLTIEDVFVLLRPSGQVQQPKLLEAIQSLKLLKCLQKHAEDLSEIEIRSNAIYKLKKLKKPILTFYDKYISEVEDERADFDILALSNQIRHECVYETNDFGNDITKWGDVEKNTYSNCISLLIRTNSLLNNPLFRSIFGFDKQKNDGTELTAVIDNFISASNDKSVLRIGFEKVGFDFQAREILANAIGKYLLMKARSGQFKDRPLVLFIDEAHQYLNKHVKDEYFELTRLTAYDQIAKECRKYGLFLCLATQMPRDIPTGTLSQMGTFIVHRLINPYDKEAVENACSSANKNSLSFLPILGEGEAILMGIDFPMPVVMKVKKPTIEPNSKTPQFKKV
jgi:uncharacterized protein